VSIEQGHLSHYLEVIYLRCLRILRDPDLAKDAMQDVFASFYERVQEETIHKPLHYLYRASTNHCLNLLRRHRRMLLIEQIADEPFLESSADAGILVDEMTHELGEEAMQLMIYRHVDQMTYEEIAEIFSCSDRAIKKRIDRLHTKAQDYARLP